jgi:hypothetical protein
VLKRDEPQTAASLLDGGREAAEAFDTTDDGAAADGREAELPGGGGGGGAGLRLTLSDTRISPSLSLPLILPLVS